MNPLEGLTLRDGGWSRNDLETTFSFYDGLFSAYKLFKPRQQFDQL